MFKAIIRFLLISAEIFIEAAIFILLDKQEIVGFSFMGRQIEKTQSEKDKILVDYLEKCKKQVYKDDKKRKRSNKKAN